MIVKVNIEGEECPTVLGTAASAWAGVDELYVETHPWAACGADELAAHLEADGLHPRRERASRRAAAATRSRSMRFDVAIPGERRLDGRARPRAERARMRVVPEDVGERPSEAGGVSRSHEPQFSPSTSP